MEPPSTHQISVENSLDWHGPMESLQLAVSAALRMQQAEPSEVCVLLTDDAGIQDLNRRFRQLNEPTDVLTFPSGEACSGDIAISIPYAKRQADARGVSLEQEVAFLAIHGALHLCGLDDLSEAERAYMVEQMNAVAVSAGFEPDEAWASLLHDYESEPEAMSAS